MTTTVPWRWLSRAPQPRGLLLSSTKGLFALSGRDFFSLAGAAAVLLAEAPVPFSAQAAALYEDDAGALHALFRHDAALLRLQWSGKQWDVKATWPGASAGENELFVFEPKRGLLHLAPETQRLTRLVKDKWVQEGVLDLGLKIKVKGSGTSFTASVDDVGEDFEGETAAAARALALKEVSAEDYQAVYEPATKRVIALANVKSVGIRCFELSPKLGRALPTPEIPPARNYLSGLRNTALAVDPKTGAALLLRRPSSYAGQQPERMELLGAKGWKKLANSAAPEWGAASTGSGPLTLLGAARKDEDGDDAETALLATWDGAWHFAGSPLLSARAVVPTEKALYALSYEGLVALEGAALRWLGRPANAVATPDGLLTVDPDGVVRKLGEKKALGGKGVLEDLRDMTMTWDGSRGAVMAFGDHQNKVTTTWEFKNGAWKALKATRKPKGRVGPLLQAVPGMGLVMVAGWNKSQLNERAVFDGKTWTVGEKLGDVDAARVLFLGYDAPTQSLLLGEQSDPDHERTASEIQVRRFIGPSQWEQVATLPFSGKGFALALESGFAYDPYRREVVGAGNIEGTGSLGFIAAPLGAVLDALPARKQAAAPAAAAPLAEKPEWFLALRDESPGKFWFAAQQGSGWTASWGKRGAKPQSKAYAFKTPALAKADLAAKVESKLAEGYAEAPEGAAVAALASRDSWNMKLGHKAAKPGEDCLHGAPIAAPACRSCKQPMEALGTFHAHPQRLPLQQAAALSIFMCKDIHCETASPTSGANAVVFVGAKSLVGERAAADTRGVTYRPTAHELDREREGLEAVSPGECKLGGYPTWVQEGEPQWCATCKQPMVLAVQLDSDWTGMNFGDVGIGYAFVCPDEHEGRFLWQCS